MWIRVRVTGGLVGPAGWEDHNLDLDKLPTEKRTELAKLIEAAGLHKGPVPPIPPPARPWPDAKSYWIVVKGPNGEAEVGVEDANTTPELKALITAVRRATGGK